MRVTILDLDWYSGASDVANPVCQKISSYYKQLGGIINFPLDKAELNLTYDLLYVVAEKSTVQVSSLIDDMRSPRLNLLGEKFRFFSRWLAELPTEIKACRPDYKLYPSHTKSDNEKTYVQFFDGDKLMDIQNYRRAASRVDTVILDKGLWQQKTEDIEKIYLRLRNDRNIVYAHENKMSYFDTEQKKEMFSKLHHKKSGDLVIECDTTIAEAIAFRQRVIEQSPNSKRITLSLKPHLPQSEGELLAECVRLLKATQEAKANKVPLSIVAPSRDLTSYWGYFEDFEAWTKYAFQVSYIEHMSYFAEMRNFTAENVMYGTKWLGARAERLRRLLAAIPGEINEYGRQEWGTRLFPHRINFKRI